MLFMILLILCILLGLSSGSLVYHQDPYEKQVIDNSVVDSHEKAIDYAISFTTYDIYSTQELLSVENLINYVDWVFRADGIDLYSITSNYDRGFSFNNNAWFVFSNILNSSNIESGGVDYMHLQNMTFHAEPRVTLDVNRNYQIFNLNFYSTISNTKFLSIAFCRVYNATLGGVYTWYTEGVYAYNSGSIEYYYPTLSLVVRSNSADVAWARQFFNFYGLGTDSTSDRYETGYNVGYSRGESIGYQNGYSDGYDQGFEDADGNFNMDPQMLTIFTGILNIGLLPVNVFLTILNFEVFGINIAGFVSSLITIAIVIIILRFIFGGKNND